MLTLFPSTRNSRNFKLNTNKKQEFETEDQVLLLLVLLLLIKVLLLFLNLLIFLHHDSTFSEEMDVSEAKGPEIPVYLQSTLLVCLSVHCITPGDKHFSPTAEGGDKHFSM